jgi:hypothetical protein
MSHLSLAADAFRVTRLCGDDMSRWILGGNPWHKCDGKLKQVHVDSNGAVWGVSANEDVFRRTGISTQNPIGSGWEQVREQKLAPHARMREGDAA